MTEAELIRLLSAHEWTDVEFKEAQRSVPKNAYETVSAFSNTAGGHLVFGVKKEGTRFEVIGVLNVDKVQNEFLSTLRQHDKISLIVDIKEDMESLDGRDILIFYVPEAKRTDKPVYLNNDTRLAFFRRGGADVRCSPEEIQRLIIDASQDRYDGQTIDLNLNTCFDTESLAWYRDVYERKLGNRSYAGKSDVEFLCELGLIRETPTSLRPSQAAILLFGRDAAFRNLLPRPVLDCQRFMSRYGEYVDGARWADRVLLESNLIRSWQSLLDWYQKLATTTFRLDPVAMQRTDEPPDYIAFRETVINILIHQDYSDHCRKPEIRYFTDRTIFWNPGDAFASEDDLLEPGEKDVRNPRIVTAFRRIGLSENAGWGIREVFRTWQTLGHVPPILHNDKANKAFSLILPKEILLSADQLMFQAKLGVHLDQDAARLFAYICREKQIGLGAAKAVLGQSAERSLQKIDYLKNQALIQESDHSGHYRLAEHLQKKLVSDQASDQVAGQTSANLVTPIADQATWQYKVMVWLKNRLQIDGPYKKIVQLVEVPRSTRALMEAVGMKHRAFFRKNILAPLLDGGLITPIHPEQPNHPKQAYVLTEAGLRLLEHMKAEGLIVKREE